MMTRRQPKGNLAERLVPLATFLDCVSKMQDKLKSEFRNGVLKMRGRVFGFRFAMSLTLVFGLALLWQSQPSSTQTLGQSQPANQGQSPLLNPQAGLNQQTTQLQKPIQLQQQTQTGPLSTQSKQAGGSSQTQPIQPPVIQAGNATPQGKPVATTQSQFDQVAAFQYLVDICKIGPRVSASSGMRKQQKMLEKHFKNLDCKIYNQPFKIRSPFNNKFVQLHNIIIQFHPERKRRLLISCHHDTRPLPDSDPVNPRGRFIGANDGASGVALLMELGKHMEKLDGEFGVDFIFFDGEEFVIQQRGQMFMGSTYFSNQYQAGKVAWKYEYGILVDMVADKDLQIYFEGNSLGFADGLTRSVWTVAKDLGVKEFIPKERHKIRDDHLPLNSIAGIRTVDIIDFDYPNPTQGNVYWHTMKDVPANCSADSLGKVGKVVLGWLREMQRLNKTKKKGN